MSWVRYGCGVPEDSRVFWLPCNVIQGNQTQQSEEGLNVLLKASILPKLKVFLADPQSLSWNMSIVAGHMASKDTDTWMDHYSGCGVQPLTWTSLSQSLFTTLCTQLMPFTYILFDVSSSYLINVLTDSSDFRLYSAALDSSKREAAKWQQLSQLFVLFKEIICLWEICLFVL